VNGYSSPGTPEKDQRRVVWKKRQKMEKLGGGSGIKNNAVNSQSRTGSLGRGKRAAVNDLRAKERGWGF